MDTYSQRPNVTGSIGNMMSDFYYSTAPGGGELLTLTGLTPGTTYTATFYCLAFGNLGGRVQISITDGQGGSIDYFDENQNGTDNGIILQDSYTASGTSITFTFTPLVGANSFHQYALTNQINSEPGAAR